MTCSLGAHLVAYRCFTVTLKFGGRVLQSLSPACYSISFHRGIIASFFELFLFRRSGIRRVRPNTAVFAWILTMNKLWRKTWHEECEFCHFVVQRDFWKVCSSMILWPALVTNPLENLCESQFIVSRRRKPSDHWGFQRSDFGSQGLEIQNFLENKTHALNIFKTKGAPLVKLVKPRPRPGNRQFLTMLW